MTSLLASARARLSPPEVERTYYRCLGAYVAALRASREIDQATVAKWLDISQSAYSRLENGASCLRIHQLEIIAEKLSYSIATILSGAQELRDSK